MKTTNTSKLSTWVLWAPLRFALTTFISVTLIGILYLMIAGAIFPSAPIPQQPLAILTTLTILTCIYLLEIKLTHNKLDQESFVLAHNTQTICASLIFISSSYLILRNYNEIAFKLMLLETQSMVLFFLTVIFGTIFLLYIPGILITNFFAKFRRIQDFNIPTWKIICSLPFGFSALWIPGYMLNNTTKKAPIISTKIKWYKKLTNLILSTPIHLIATFIPVTLMSGFLFGLNGVLLTFILALIFGVWVLKVGQEKFIKDIGGHYTSLSIIINLILIITTICIVRFTPPMAENIQINITETQLNINK